MTGTTLVLPLLAAVMLVVCPLGGGRGASHAADREPWSGLGPAVWLLPAALAVLTRIG
ncbi:MAG: hypothetical protein SF070_15080 [Gemmatimonadota bacterium]|nr:hypothetical protein [Gemmatimonadota bacterium]